jgi:hypothetical protein
MVTRHLLRGGREVRVFELSGIQLRPKYAFAAQIRVSRNAGCLPFPP